MKSILDACQPRGDLLTGGFNPEIFTASLSQVLDRYRGRPGVVQNIYTDPRAFFSEATYPTNGLRTSLAEIFGRLAGDASLPAIHRLETAFGGGKTHSLIAATHIGHRGAELRDITAGIVEPGILPKPGEISVVGVPGDEIAVHKPRGKDLVPYTLWGEIAYQVGGESLYKHIGEEATSFAAPGKGFFEKVFGGRKVLIMLDELAQYAARIAAARAEGADQLAAFVMGLNGYARTHDGISVVVTLASARDAFANQTQTLAKLLGQVRGEKVTEDEALGIGQEATAGLTSVVARDATLVVPVQAAEIASVLAKRLFERVDPAAAKETAEAYAAMYARNQAMLPDEATRADHRERMTALYPFHPTLIDFLNRKLSTFEDFHGTRGVLRVLANAVRSIWSKKQPLPMIHAAHLDLRDARTVNEVINRTGSGDLLPILNADVGGPDTEQIEGGRSNAQLVDLRNPHPEQHPMVEYTWRTVFLHSLADRDRGLESNVFGLTEADAIWACAFPGADDGTGGLSPHQVKQALDEIEHTAYYLHGDQGRYYATPEPSVNKALAQIRRTIPHEQMEQFLDSTARKVVRGDTRSFSVHHDVSQPEHIPDDKGKPALALVALSTGTIDVETFFTTKGPNRPRNEQNLVLLLVPETVAVKGEEASGELIPEPARHHEKLRSVEDLARTVLAMRRLREKPHDFGVNPRRLDEDDFRQRQAERENSLISEVTRLYTSLWFAGSSGRIVRRPIQTAGAEGGAPVFDLVRQALLDAHELITSQHTQQSHLASLSQLFFADGDTMPLAKLRENFSRLRRWPILEMPELFEQVIRAGVSKAAWCVFRMGSDESTKPDELYSRETGNDLPFDVDLSQPGFSLVTVAGANKRGWTTSDEPDPAKVREWVKEVIAEKCEIKVAQVAEAVAEKYGTVAPQAVTEAVTTLIRDDRAGVYRPASETATGKDEYLHGSGAALIVPKPDDVIVTKARASEKGLIVEKPKGIHLQGRDAVDRLLPLIRRIGSLYMKGGKSTVDELDLTDLELPKGGKLRIGLTNVPPESMKLLAEFLEVVAGLAKRGPTTEAWLKIERPQQDCPFVEELRK